MSSKKSKHEKIIDNLINDFWFSNEKKLKQEEGEITQDFISRNMMGSTARVGKLVGLNKEYLQHLAENIIERLMKSFLRISPTKSKDYVLKAVETEFKKLNRKIPGWLNESGQLDKLNQFQNSVDVYMTEIKKGVENRCDLWEEQRAQRKKWWQDYPLFIAIVAVFISIYSAYLSRKEFIAAHRPYVYGISRKSDNGTMDLNSVLISCFNAPAKIINREIYYVTIKITEDGKENDEIKFQKKFSNEIVLYPTEIPTSQISVVEYDFKKEILEKEPEVKLRRKVRIDYQELSRDKTHYFEGNWDYNNRYKIWEDGNIFGN